MRSRIPLLIFLALVLFVLCAAPSMAATITLSATGASDQTAINNALNTVGTGGIVHLNPGTYVITSSIMLVSGTTLEGSGIGSTIIKPASASVCNSESEGVGDGYIYGKTVSNVVVRNIKIQGPGTSTSDVSHSGGLDQVRHGIHLRGSSGITFHDMYFTLLYNDGMRISACSNIIIYNCQFLTPGHDGIALLRESRNVHIYNIIVCTNVNAGVRFDGSSNCELDHSTFYSDTGSGYCGLELETSSSNNNVHQNIFRNMHNSRGYGIVNYNVGSGTITVTNNIFYDVPLPMSMGGLTVTQSGNQLNANAATDWVSQGFGYNSSGSGGGDSAVVLPVYNGGNLTALTYPSNNANIQTQNGEIAFTWSDVNSTSYYIQVAVDPNFVTSGGINNSSSLVYDGVTGSTASSVALPMIDGTYYWRIQAYDDAHGTWTQFTSANMFIVSGNAVVATGGVSGLIYDTTTAHPIGNAIVYISSGSWSASYVTSANGRYSFPSLLSGTTYAMTVTASGYLTTPIALPITLNGTIATEDIALQKAQTYFEPNYVTIKVQDAIGGSPYTDVKVSVYTMDKNVSTNPADSDPADISSLTDKYGNAIFILNKDTMYTVVAYDPTQNINKRETFTPASNLYIFGIWFGRHKAVPVSINDKPIIYQVEDIIVYNGPSWSINRSNVSVGYINQSFWTKDGSAITSWTTNITEVNDNASTTVASNGGKNFSYFESGTGNAVLSTMVPSNRRYHITTIILAPVLNNPITGVPQPQTYEDTLEIRNGIMAGFDLGWKAQWNYELIGFIIILLMAGLFGSRSAGVGSIMLLLGGFFFKYIGWFAWSTGDTLMASFAIVLVLAYLLLGRR